MKTRQNDRSVFLVLKWKCTIFPCLKVCFLKDCFVSRI